MPDPQPLVSVVTPFYNTADYLGAAIESVLGQTYTNFEYILADNVSTDGSAEIAARSAAGDPRVKLVRCAEHIPQVPNYNRALRLVSPEAKYVKLVQADDLIFPECLARMVELAEAHPSVGLVSAYQLEGDHINCDAIRYPTPVQPGRDLLRAHLAGARSLWGTPTTVLYRADLVRQLDPLYPENTAFDDTEACYRLLLRADFGFVHQVLTFTRTENDSIFAGIRSFNPTKLHQLMLLHTYGAQVLEPAERRALFARVQREYFTFLGEARLRRKGPKFWAYHRAGLARLGLTHVNARIAAAVVWAALDALGNPKRTLVELLSGSGLRR